MERYRSKFKESVSIIEDEDVIYLSDNSYHFHKKDIEDGIIPIEFEVLENICKELNIDYINLDKLIFMKCCSEIYKAIQITYNSISNKE